MAVATISVAKWMDSLRSTARLISDPCVAARTVLVLADGVLSSAQALADKALAREGGPVIARSLLDDLTQARSRFDSYSASLDGVGAARDVDSRIVCESVTQYLLDGRTSDPSMAALTQPDASAAASLWNRAFVLVRTSDPADVDIEATDVLAKAADDAGAAISGAGQDAIDALARWREAIKAIGAGIAERAENIVTMLAIGLGLGLVLWLTLGRR